MKIISKVIMISMLVSSLSAESENWITLEGFENTMDSIFSSKPLKSTDSVSYMSYQQGSDSTDEKIILGMQPLSEIIGSGGVRHEIQYGYAGTTYDGIKTARVYAYGWSNPEKNEELGLGIGGEYIFHPFHYANIGIVFGGKAGLGYQPMDGKTDVFSTNANKVSYITNDINKDPTQQLRIPTRVEYLTDTYLISISLKLGLEYAINKHWSVAANIESRQEYYQVAYINEGSEIRNSLTMFQNSMYGSFSVAFSF